MKFRVKAKLKPGQIKDLRTSGAVRRRAADMIPDSADRPVSQEQAQAEEMYRRYGQITYTQAYRPVGHIRPQTVHIDPSKKRNRFSLQSERPDGADRTQPYRNKRVKVKRSGTSH